jgi:hypothetical protein
MPSAGKLADGESVLHVHRDIRYDDLGSHCMFRI